MNQLAGHNVIWQVLLYSWIQLAEMQSNFFTLTVPHICWASGKTGDHETATFVWTKLLWVRQGFCSLWRDVHILYILYSWRLKPPGRKIWKKTFLPSSFCRIPAICLSVCLSLHALVLLHICMGLPHMYVYVHTMCCALCMECLSDIIRSVIHDNITLCGNLL